MDVNVVSASACGPILLEMLQDGEKASGCATPRKGMASEEET